jgi:predicted nucleic acid-binding protein
VSKELLPSAPELVDLAVDLQRKLFAVGMGKAVGETDLQIAATALHYSNDDQTVEIVHYDSDFDHLSSIEPRLRTRWIVSRGTA